MLYKATFGLALALLFVPLLAPAFIPLEDPTPSHTFLDRGGPVLTHPQVELIFWGDFSARIGPPPEMTRTAVSTILSSSYTDGLRQYRNINSASLSGTVYLNQSNPPSLFTTRDVQYFLQAQIQKGTIPSPDVAPELVYAVIMPTTVNSRDQEGLGGHNFFRYYTPPALAPPTLPHVSVVHFLWVSNDGGLPYVTNIFSHELVETITDPQVNAFTASNYLFPLAGHCPKAALVCEIADVCDAVRAEVQGVTVASYWSERERRCRS